MADVERAQLGGRGVHDQRAVWPWRPTSISARRGERGGRQRAHGGGRGRVSELEEGDLGLGLGGSRRGGVPGAEKTGGGLAVVGRGRRRGGRSGAGPDPRSKSYRG